MLRQADGHDGKFILSKDDKILDFSKNVALIYNLFELDSNRKKLINRLYEKLKKRIFESDLHMRYQSILADMERFVNDLEGLSEYMLQYSLDIDVTHFLKFMDVRIAEEEQTFLERLSDHLKLLVDLLGVELIILVNLRSCLDEAEAVQLYEMINYYKIPVLLLESAEREMIKYEHRYIIDSDLCII